MTRKTFESLNLEDIASRCLVQADRAISPQSKKYWEKCNRFVNGCRVKTWEQMSLNMRNWLNNIVQEV